MTIENLTEEIEIEFESLETAVNELVKLRNDVGEEEPSMRELTAASAFLAQFYNGLENILKRFYKFFNKPLPVGADWHIILFRSFCDPPEGRLPMLFPKEIEKQLIPYRKFRHVVHHGYGFQIDWERIKPGIDEITIIFSKISKSIKKVLNDLSLEMN